MHKKQWIRIAAAAALICTTTILVYSVYSTSSFNLPGAFDNLAQFAPEELAFYAEFPSLHKDWNAFKESSSGKLYADHPLLEQLLPLSITDKLRQLMRSLRGISGLPLDEDSLVQRLDNPAAIIILDHTKALDTSLLLLTISDTDRVLLNLFSSLAEISTADSTLSKEDWNTLSIYSAGPGQTLSFALVNNILLVGSDSGLIKNAVYQASKDKAARPAGWERFLNKSGKGSFFARFYCSAAMLTDTLSAYSGMFSLPAGISMAYAELQLTPGAQPSIKGGLHAAYIPAGSGEHLMQLIPDDALASFAGNSFNYTDLRLNKNIKPFFDAIPENLALQLMQIFTECEGPWAMNLAAIRDTQQRSFPSFSLIWKLKSNTRTAVGQRALSLLRSLPGSRPVQFFHLNTGYFALQRSQQSIERNEPMIFTPCVAVLDEHLIFSLDEVEMKKTIGLLRGHAKPRIGTETFKNMRAKLPGATPLYWASLNLKQSMETLRRQMSRHAFVRASFSRQEVNAAFAPVLAASLPFEQIDLWVGRISDNEAELRIVFDND